MGLEGGGKTDIAQQDADAGSFQAEATGLLHAGQAKLAHGHDATAKPASPKQVLPKSSNNHTAELKPGMPGLNADNFHQQTRDLLFQHDTHGVPVAFQPQVDITAVGLPQIHFDNGAQPDNGDNVRPQQLPPEGSERPQPQPEFTNHIVKRGDSLWKIARENLPKGASNRIVANYVHQIEADNPMHDPNLIMPGQIIKLRGYASATEHDTAHGAERHGIPERYRGSRQHEHYRAANHHTENVNPNPAEENEPPPVVPPPSQSDKPAPAKDAPLPPVKNNDADGDKSTLKTTPPKDQEEKLLEPFKNTPITLNIEQNRRQLAELAHNRMGDGDEYRKFVDNIYSFEHRANSEIAEKLHLQGKSPEETVTMVTQEIHDTYKNAGDLLRTQQTDKLTPVELQHLASEEMQQAAHWQDIDQGQHPTCQSTAIEKRLYADNPSLVTQIVTQAALTGKYTAPDETTVEIDPSPHDKEAQRFPTLPGQRSLASQIFDDAAVNVTWAKLNPRVHYEWHPADHASGRPAGSYLMMGGEEITSRQDKGMSAPVSIRPGDTGILEQDIPLMFDTITGKHDESAVILASQSPEALQNKVQELKQRGDLPAVFAVNAGNKPFSEYADGPGGHLVLLDDYIPAKNGHPAEAMVDNSWGFTHDGERAGAGLMTFQTLYKATLVPATQSR